MAKVVHFGVHEKFAELKMRKEEQKKLGAKIDKIVQQAEHSDQPKGCGLSMCGLFSRWQRRGSTRTSTVDLDSEAAAISSSTSDNVGFQRAVFGLAGVKKGDPAAKLEEAAAVMRGRISQLDERAQGERKQAVILQKAGQKMQALRSLKKAKATEQQLEANQASLMAVEQQVDLLAQAAMQRTLTSALASTSKSMKADGKMIGKAEQAIDQASEARDLANDLNEVVADFANNGASDINDDDLMAELEAMSVADEPPPPPEHEEMSEGEKAAEISRLEAAIAERQDRLAAAKAVRESFPSAPNGAMPSKGKSRKKEEKAGLLAEIL